MEQKTKEKAPGLTLEPKTTQTQSPVIQESSNLPEVTPMVLMQNAISRGATVEQMQDLWALNEKVEAANAKKAYVKAMAEFKKNAPEIDKDKQVNYQNKDLSWTSYRHASIGNVVDKITEGLAMFGFSHKWDIDQAMKDGGGGLITVTCVITHELGHSEAVPLSASPDTSGGKNSIQAVASTITYLERYSLLAATGLATQDMLDDDGRTAGLGEGTQGSAVKTEQEPVKPITEEESTMLHARITDNGLNMDKIKRWLKAELNIDTLEEIPAPLFNKVNNKISATIKVKREQQA